MKTIVFVLLITLAGFGLAAEPPAKQPTPTATARAKKLKNYVASFSLGLTFLTRHRENTSPCCLSLMVPHLDPASNKPPYMLFAQINEPQATRLIDHLALEGFLDNFEDMAGSRPQRRHVMPGYLLHVYTDRLILEEDLGWGLPMLKRLDALRKRLDGDAAKQMDLLLGGLAGHREEWEKNESKAKPANKDSAR